MPGKGWGSNKSHLNMNSRISRELIIVFQTRMSFIPRVGFASTPLFPVFPTSQTKPFQGAQSEDHRLLLVPRASQRVQGRAGQNAPQAHRLVDALHDAAQEDLKSAVEKGSEFLVWSAGGGTSKVPAANR